MKKKLLKINSILLIVISSLIILLLSIYTIKYFFTPLDAQETWHELGKIFLIASVIIAYITNIPAILSGIFSLLYINGIKLKILSNIFSGIHIFLELLLVYLMFMDPLKITGWNSGFYTLSVMQILLIVVLVISGIPSLINIILLYKYENNGQ